MLRLLIFIALFLGVLIAAASLGGWLGLVVGCAVLLLTFFACAHAVTRLHRIRFARLCQRTGYTLRSFSSFEGFITREPDFKLSWSSWYNAAVVGPKGDVFERIVIVDGLFGLISGEELDELSEPSATEEDHGYNYTGADF